MKVSIDLEKLKEYAKTAKPWVYLLPLVPPPFLAGALLFELLEKHGRLTKDDAQNVVEIIKAGADANVDALNIRMRKQDAIGLEVKLRSLKTQRPFTFVLGVDNETEYEIKVKYK